MKKTMSMSSKMYLTFVLFSSFLFIWILFSVALTWCTAVSMDRYLEKENGKIADNIVNAAQLQRIANDPGISTDTKEYWIWDGVNSNWLNNSFGGGLLHRSNLKPQSAVVLYDGEGNLVEKNENTLFVRYITEANWYSQKSDMNFDGVFKTLYDPSRINQTALQVIRRTDWIAMRFTGDLKDGLLTPSKIEYVSYDAFRDILAAHYENGQFERHKTIQDMEMQYGLAWETLLVSSYEEEGQQIFYSLNASISYYSAGDSFKLKGRKYEDLMDYVLHIDDPSAYHDYDSYKQGNLWHTLITDSRMIYAEKSEEMIPAYKVVAAVRYSPLKIALDSLLYVYIGSFLFLLLVGMFLWRVFYYHLVCPVESFNEAVEQDWAPIRSLGRTCLWEDGQRLRDHYYEIRMERSRLTAFLQYAREAEGNRRQMTSHIAHELKTPLAIIHSYAEGLKERIAEEKRDQYIDVILSEVERTDGMVLEMLDLSRLEAGRIKLSRDTFSLNALTYSVFKKFEMAIAAKALQVGFDFPKDYFITADEGRITQVVENFATNAIKYTLQGGSIQVSIQTRRNSTIFRIENECTPLSDEALLKVWDPFYRTDEARSGGGTGLGLAIAKNIIELHGGKCYVCNTKTGAAFSFAI